ncbi:hypothetical protein SAMN05421664_3411 [Chryseobacterium soldanellicola]|uniref:Uncharacterized protein n=1 Tax=Chryseobacterium soldanellicola TaxID=311333 RepID=A0A1H1G2X5_9FLAO|nr:hypothetical protein [Chryseobacterium soldanellicola]SDR07425.1 hypothetical protein SAMN05421664_3411 [Chryseobacterium soldanellicola]
MIENPDFIPQICYLVDSENNSFYLYIVIRTIHYNRKYSARTQEFLEVWGIKELDENFEYISINKKKWTDKIAGIFSSFNINIKDDDFKDFYVLGSDQFKTKNFLSPKRKETIKLFPDKDFKLEIKNNILSFGLSKKLSLARALQISKFLKDI